jgi:hypothetical protein
MQDYSLHRLVLLSPVLWEVEMNGETEGVIKFHLDYRYEPLKDYDIASLSVWRMILKQPGLLGQHVDRYDGYGFGNGSFKCADGFLISGTQTGALDSMKLEN